jgi:hypothetical protein
MPEFYGNATDFRAYHLERGNAVDVDVDDADIDICLLVGAEWMDAQYREHLTGLKVGERAQIREQPRNSQTDIYGYSIASDIIPREYIDASYEIAFKHLITPGVLNADYTPGKYDSVSVDGAISVKFTKFNSISEIQTKFSKVGQIMATLVSQRSNLSSLSSTSSRI